MHSRRFIVVVAAIIVAGAASRALAFVGLVVTEQGAQLLAAKVTEWRNDLVAEAASDANRAKLFDRLKQAREALTPIKESASSGVAELDKRLEQLRAGHEGDPAGWPAAARAELQRTQAAREQLQGVDTTLGTAWDNLKWLQGRQNVEGFDPFRNETFRQRFEQLGQQVGSAAEVFAKFNNTYRLESATRGDADSPTVVVGASFATVQVVQPGVIWRANGVTLGPAKGEAVPIRLGDHGSLTLRAVALDDSRKHIRGVLDQVAAGKGTAVVDSGGAKGDILSYLKYHVGELSTELTCTDERYEWQFGRNVTAAVGKPSPWAADKTPVPEPVQSSSADHHTNDTLTWWLPAVEEQTVVFGFTATGRLTWQRKRVLAGGRVVDAEVTGTQAGELAVTVTSR